MRPTTLTALCLFACLLGSTAAIAGITGTAGTTGNSDNSGNAASAGSTETKTSPPPPSDASREGAEPGPYFTHYKIRFLDDHAAEVLAWQQCAPEAGGRCRVTPSGIGGIDVIADAATQRKIAQALAREDATPNTQNFQLVLLLADDQPGDPSALGKGARKAVDDLRGFLPYKGYHQLDAAWLRASDRLETRLTGKDGQTYSLGMSFDTAGVRESQHFFVRAFSFREEPSAAISKANRPPRSLLSTSFGLKLGETLVVGTSKLDGGDALVLLVTALPPS